MDGEGTNAKDDTAALGEHVVRTESDRTAHASGQASAARLAGAVVWAQRRRLALGLVLLVVDRAAGFVVPLSPKVLVDDVIGGRRADLLPWLGFAVVAASIVQAAAGFALARVLGISAERVVLGWRRRVMARITRLRMDAIESTTTGALVSRVMDDANTLQNLVGWELVRFANNILTALVALAALVVLDWRITLAALAVAAVPGLGFHRAHVRLRPLFRERSVLRADVAGRLAQTVAGLRVVKAYAAERREELVFTRGLHRLHRVMVATTTRRGLMSALAVVVSASIVAIVVVMGGRAILAGTMTLGAFASYVAFALMFASPLLDLPEIATRVTETLADLDRIRGVLESPVETAATATERVAGDAGARVAPRASPGAALGVGFDGVTFAYEADRPVLRDVSFDVRPGTTTALVGASGAGKSTVFALLLGFYRPSAGRVSIGGEDLARLELRAHRKRVAIVLQDDFLFDGTVADNIAFSRPGASREAIEAASRAAHCDEFLARTPLGLDTIVGERGVKLSGGQRQRVSIARAILADAPLLLLDEATASLDSESESLVKDAVTNLRRGRTVLVIAHRLSTIRAADQILVLDRGAIVDRGTHDELLGREGRYRDLHDAQFGG